MVRAYIQSAVAGAFLLGMATAAVALTGEYGNSVRWALPSVTDIQTDCSINAQVQGKTYCFGSKEAMAQFMQTPKDNLAKAQTYFHRSIGSAAGSVGDNARIRLQLQPRTSAKTSKGNNGVHGFGAT